MWLSAGTLDESASSSKLRTKGMEKPSIRYALLEDIDLDVEILALLRLSASPAKENTSIRNERHSCFFAASTHQAGI